MDRRRETEEKSTEVIIIGAGCAGLAAGIALQKRNIKTTIVEKSSRVGGLAGGVEIGGNIYEYGPHIFHTTDPEILADIKRFCGDVLQPFKRSIKIKFGSRYFSYPLSLLDIVTKLPPLTVLMAGLSLAKHMLLGVFLGSDGLDNSEKVLRRYYGDVLYRIFFRDYIEKVWGMKAAEMSPHFAGQRLPKFSLKKFVLRLWWKLVEPPLKEVKTDGYVEEVEGEFFTTSKGFSLICERLADEYNKSGGTIILNAEVTSIVSDNGRCRSVRWKNNSQLQEKRCSWVVSTMPISLLPGVIRPSPPRDVHLAAESLRFRGIIFVGLLVSKPTVLPASFMYFRDKTFNRITDLARFGVEISPRGATILIAEITAQPDSPVWLNDRGTGDIVVSELVADRLISRTDVLDVNVFKAEHGYPIYSVGYDVQAAKVNQYVTDCKNLFSIGRQGSFAYINTHVAMKMGYETAREIQARSKIRA